MKETSIPNINLCREPVVGVNRQGFWNMHPSRADLLKVSVGRYGKPRYR